MSPNSYKRLARLQNLLQSELDREKIMKTEFANQHVQEPEKKRFQVNQQLIEMLQKVNDDVEAQPSSRRTQLESVFAKRT